MKQYKKMLFVVAHPDDAEISFGGTILKLIKQGYNVKVLVMTNGELAIDNVNKRINKKIRYLEQINASNYGNYSIDFLGVKDGHVTNSIKIRKKLIKKILMFRPDVIFTHKKNDYHPDHRYTSILIEDCLVMCSVKKYIKKIDPLNYNPIVLFACNKFGDNNKNNIIVDITDVYQEKIKLAFFHKSQFKDFKDCQKTIEDIDNVQSEILKNKYKGHFEIYNVCDYALESEKRDFLFNNKFGVK